MLVRKTQGCFPWISCQLFLKQDSSFGSSVNPIGSFGGGEGYFLGQYDLPKGKSNISYKLVLWISTFSARSKSSPENEIFFFPLCSRGWIFNSFLFLDADPIHIKIEKNKQRYILIARGNIIRGNSIPSKNNLKGIRMGIGPIWGINSLTPLSSLVTRKQLASLRHENSCKHFSFLALLMIFRVFK